MILEPTESTGLLEALRQIGCRIVAVAKIHGITGAVFGISRGSRDLGPFHRSLIALRLHIKKDTFLKILGAVAAQQPEINTVSGRRTSHG